MNIWVIGSLGMLGREIFSLLKKRKMTCRGSSRDQADITSLKSLRSFADGQRFTHIINCAGYTAVEKAEEEKDLCFAVNAQGVENIATLAKEMEAKVVHFSTDYVFDGEKKTPYSEEDLCAPLSVYGKSKQEGERILLKENDRAVLIRTSWLFGFGKDHFVKKILHQMQNKEEIFVIDDQYGRPTFTKDLAKASLSLFPLEGIFHFANSGSLSWYELAKYIYERALFHHMELKCKKIHPVKTKDFFSKARRPFYSVLDTSKIESFLGKIPSWKGGIDKVILKLLKENDC